jgi:hypothetical protein
MFAFGLGLKIDSIKQILSTLKYRALEEHACVIYAAG